jgi:hypothetical protein
LGDYRTAKVFCSEKIRRWHDNEVPVNVTVFEGFAHAQAGGTIEKRNPVRDGRVPSKLREAA